MYTGTCTYTLHLKECIGPILITFVLCSSNETVQFEDFVYMTQVVQSVCITAEAEHYRRILTEDGYTRGTLYWQLVYKH